jgi:hypothetical protein
MSIDPTKGSVNTQLANAVAACAVANDRLDVVRNRLAGAKREETAAINAVNEAQKHFDELVALVKKSAPYSTDWKLLRGEPA